VSAKPRPHTVTLRANKTSTCRNCAKRLVRTHTFYAPTFAEAHRQRHAWACVTKELCQSCAS
jgi:hypothetical protein